MRLNNIMYKSRNLFTSMREQQCSCDVAYSSALRPIAASLSKCPPFFLPVKLVTFFPYAKDFDYDV